jgi:hypothetical protein
MSHGRGPSWNARVAAAWVSCQLFVLATEVEGGTPSLFPGGMRGAAVGRRSGGGRAAGWGAPARTSERRLQRQQRLQRLQRRQRRRDNGDRRRQVPRQVPRQVARQVPHQAHADHAPDPSIVPEWCVCLSAAAEAAGAAGAVGAEGACAGYRPVGGRRGREA